MDGGRARLITPVFLLVTFANFAYFASVGMVAPVLPRYIEGSLGSSGVGVGLGVGAFTVTSLLLRPFSGRLGDMRGRRLPMFAGLIANSLSLALYAVTTSLATLVAARLITGIGEALFFVGATAAINDLAPDDRRGEAISFFSLALFTGLAVGPVLGETLLGRGHFDRVWLAAAAVGALGIPLTLAVRDTRTHIGAVSARLLHRAAVAPGAILFCGVWGLAAFNAFIPLYVLQLGMSGSRIVFLVNASIIFLYRSLGARIPDRLGAVTTARLALLSIPIGLMTLAVWRDVPGLFAGVFFLSTGQALSFPALMTLAVHRAPASERGAVLGTFTAFFDLSFGIGALTLGAISNALGYNGAFAIAAVVASLGLAQLLIRPPGPSDVRVEPQPDVSPA